MPEVSATTGIACPDQATLHRMASGELPDEVAWETAQHFSVCTRCASIFDSILDPLVIKARMAPAIAEKTDVLDAVVARAKALIASAVNDSTVEPNLSSSVDRADIAHPSNRTIDYLPPGKKLGKFQLLQELGRGGMGAVYRALDTSLDREVAIKLILTEQQTATPSQRARFLREARSAARLRHPNIVPVFEVGEAEGTPFIVMPLLPGTTLASMLREKGAFPPSEVVRLGGQMANGLHAAHQANLIHRDIKPANVWIEPRDGGTVQLLDFGLAKPTENSADDLTGGNAFAGTPQYMSPEQADAEALDHRSDLFSLGLVLYEMAQGKPLFYRGKDRPSVLSQVRSFKAKSAHDLLPGSPPALATIIANVLHPNAKLRSPQTAGELANLLAGTSQDLLSNPQPSRRRLPRSALVCLAILLACLITAASYQVVVIVKKHPEDAGARIELPKGAGLSFDKDGNPIVTLDPMKPSEGPSSGGEKKPKFANPPGGKLASLDELSSETISADHRRMLTFDGRITQPKQLVAAMRHPAMIMGLALHPNGFLLASGGHDGSIHIWRLVGTEPEQSGVLKEKLSNLRCATYSPDGKYLIAGNDHGKIMIWNGTTHELVTTFDHPGESVTSIGVAPDCREFAVGSGSETLRIYDLPPTNSAGEIFRGNRVTVQSIAYTSDSKRLLIGSNSLLKLYDARKQTELASIQEPKVWYSAIVIHPRRELFAANGGGAPIDSRNPVPHIFPGFGDNVDKSLQNSLSIRDLNRNAVTLKLMKHDSRVRKCGFSDDGKRLITVTLNSKLHLWDWETERRLCELQFAPTPPDKTPEYFWGFTVHPDGRHAIVGLTNGLIAIYRLDS